MSFLQHTALDQIIEALGWMLEKKVDDVVDRHVTSLVCVPKPAALAVSYEDLIYRLAIHLFLVKIRSWKSMGKAPSIRCRIKLWHTSIWDAHVDPSTQFSH